jgi:hypothetical protein
VISNYCQGELSETTVRDNFTVIYQVQGQKKAERQGSLASEWQIRCLAAPR